MKTIETKNHCFNLDKAHIIKKYKTNVNDTI